MISWIQVTFEKHTKVFLAFLLIVITIPFVFTIGAAPGIGRGERTITKRDFFGYNLVNPGTQQRLIRDARLCMELRPEAIYTSGVRSIDEFAYMRTAALALADRYRVPQPTAAERSRYLTTLRTFQNEQGQFDSVRYNQFRDAIRKSQGEVSESDVARVLAEEIRIEKIDKLLAGPGFVAPAEIACEIELLGSEWTLQVATFDLEAYNPVPQPSTDVLEKYFEDNAAAFEIPERVSLDYVTFAAADFASNAPIGDDAVVSFFEANKQHFATPAADGKPAAEPVLADVRPQVEAAMRASLATNLAARAASDFAYELFDKKIAKDSPAIDALVAQFKGRRATAPLFSQQTPPTNLGWNNQIVAAAFQLDDSRYFSDALQSGANQIVLLWHETFPRTKANFNEVHDDVLAAYLEQEKAQAIHRNGEAWKATLAAKVAAGTSFADAVAALPNAPKSEVKDFGPFTLEKRPEGLSGIVLNALTSQQARSVSDLLVDDKHGYIIWVAAKKVPTVDPQSADYAATRTALSANVAAATRALSLNALVAAELARTEPQQPTQ